jgi:hypothetical protein
MEGEGVEPSIRLTTGTELDNASWCGGLEEREQQAGEQVAGADGRFLGQAQS